MIKKSIKLKTKINRFGIENGKEMVREFTLDQILGSELTILELRKWNFLSIIDLFSITRKK